VPEPDRNPLVLPGAALLASAVVLTAVAISQPFAVNVIGVMVLGSAHVLCALRYLAGRISDAVTETTGWLLVVIVATMALVRVVTALSPGLGHRLELGGSMAILATALWIGLTGRLRYLVIVPVAVIGIAAFLELPWYWHLLTHAHNLVPLIFLWDWARRRRPGSGLAFTAINLSWALVVPAVILAGVVDPLINAVPPPFITTLADPAFVLASAAQPHSSPEMAVRFLVVFSYLQAMHYVIWMVFFQIAGRSEISRLASRFPIARGRWFWLLAVAVSLLIWLVYALGYYDGRAVYGIVGAANVYLEQPIAVWLLLTVLPAGATSGLIHRLGQAQ
jgi:hypothetical protein